jgi:glycosyltransferase involved in cell wall biosynthesis
MENSTTYSKCKDLLGPIFHLYLTRLDAHIRSFATDQRTRILFVSRAGVRIRKLYNAYLKAHKLSEPQNIEYLWASRILVAKAIWQKAPALSCAVVGAEFRHAKLCDVVKALYAGSPMTSAFQETDPILQQPGSRFQEFVWSQHAVAHDLRWHLTQQSEWWTNNWVSLVGEANRIVLVDSGWQGTIQRMLADAYSDVEFWGLYFGRSGFENTDRRYWHQMLGLAFEADTFDPSLPASAITLHRHLIESMLEPAAPSVETMTVDDDGTPYCIGSSELLADKPNMEAAPAFMGVLAYLEDKKLSKALPDIVARGQEAARQLALVLAYPTQQDALALGSVARSADFGRSSLVDTLLKPEDRFEGDSAERRIENALWASGQAALEYDDEIVAHRQKLEIPSGHSISKLKNLLWEKPKTKVSQPAHNHPLVAVITRTMDRPIFLRRALRSVADQQYKNYVHVIVCDGGDMEAVHRTVQESPVDPSKIILVDNVVNRGMEAASNIAIKSCDSDYIVIHDDDDTWHPQFLQKMVDFLGSPSGKKYGGAISHTNYISEEVLRSSIVERSRQSYNDWVNNVSLLEMASQNMFAPIAFMFKRSIYNQIGGFDEKFPVLGDWDFNLRFLMIADIGVLPQKLANYHHRDVGNKKLFGNSVIAGIDKHAEFNSIMRNKHVRACNQGGHALAVITAMGSLQAEYRSRETKGRVQLGELIKSRTGNNSDKLPATAWELLRRMSAQLEDRWNTIAVLVQQLDRAKADRSNVK